MDANEKKVMGLLAESAKNIDVPSSLEPESVLALLEKEEQEKSTDDQSIKETNGQTTNSTSDRSAECANNQSTKSKGDQSTASVAKKGIIKRFFPNGRKGMQWAMAACLAILCGVGLLTIGVLSGKSQLDSQIGETNLSQSSSDYATPDITSQIADGVSSVPVASSYQQLYDLIKSVPAPNETEEIGDMLESHYSDSSNSDIPISGLMDSAKQDNALSSGTGDYSQTNVRTEGIDEADVVKTDGIIIYSLQNYGSKLSLVGVNDGKMKKLATIKAKSVSKDVSDFVEFFVANNRVYLISNVYKDDSSGNPNTKLATFDVSNPEKPNLIATTEQAGYYHSARIADGNLYLFTSFYPELGSKKNNVKMYVPTVGDEPLACNDVYVPECVSPSNYLVIGSINLNEPSKIAETKAVLSGGDGVYVSDDSIYVYGSQRFTNLTKDNNGDAESESPSDSASSKMRDDKDIALIVEDYSSDTTVICKLSYNDGSIESIGETTVDGHIDDGLSIDEYQGNTRVVTTSYESDGQTSNNLYVLNEKMEEIGALTNIAPGERVYSARLMGNIGYFVTYREVDPLFSVDLSDPSNPKIIGQLKIPGFSEYLHPWGEGRLLGIGQATTKNGSITNGIKLSMFDTSDPSNVREIDSFVIKNVYYADALYDYRAVYVDVDRGLIGFSSEGIKAIYYMFSYNDKEGFSEKLADNLTRYTSYSARGVRIGEVFYVVAQSVIESYNMNSFDEISKLKL